jgi:glutathione S-transferase
MTYVLHIADKPYSSWSLRGWLMLRAFGLPFEERLHRLYDPAFDAFTAAHAPARSVPALAFEDGGAPVLLWDSLAIAETLAERHPQAGHWPAAPAARAAARALAAEMHSGFAALRSAAPMNTRREGRPIAVSDAVRADLDRLCALWAWARGRWGAGGPFLFGAAFTAADAFFAPVAFRVAGYALPVTAEAAAYLAALRAHPAVAEWVADAAADPRRIERYDAV